jgi:hypothetical protein
MSQDENDMLLPGFTADQLRPAKIFYPFAFERIAQASKDQIRFVHYTSADTAMRIIQNNEVWMRKASAMNDFMEIEHGFECLNIAYKGNKERFQSLFNGMFPGFTGRLEERFNDWLPHFRTDTYVTSVSVHDGSEDRYGRLSMWRAYGGVSGIAIVMKSTPFLQPSKALNAYTSPVAYLDHAGFDTQFNLLLDSVESNADFVRNMGEEAVFAFIFSAFRSAILCTKHPGFFEEKEWRVIHSPKFEKSDRIAAAIESIKGIPQTIYKIPLKDVPDENLVGIEIPELIDRIIVGPTQFPVEVHGAFIALLEAAGVTDAANKVVISDLPLRS